jgi:hypothetical protein
MRVQLALIKLGVVTDADLDRDMAFLLWGKRYIVYRNTRTNSKPLLHITDDGEAFLNK